MKYEKIKLPEREEAFNKKMDSLFTNINKGIEIAFNGVNPEQTHSCLSELESLGYVSMMDLLYHSKKSVLSLESVVANDVKLVNDIIKDSYKVLNKYVFNFNVDIIELQTPTVCIDSMKKYIIDTVVGDYAISSRPSEVDKNALLKVINSSLYNYSFEYAYDKQKNHLVLVALTDEQLKDIERDMFLA